MLIFFFTQEIILWRKQDKAQQKNSAQQYAHFESPNAPVVSEDSVADMNAEDNSAANGPSSSGNNSDSPSD